MKIVQIITKSEPIGGAQMVLYNLLSGLKEKHDITVIIGEDGRLTKEIRALNIKCIILSSLQREINVIKDIKAYFGLKSMLKEIKPDIVASHSSKAGYISRLVCYKLKIPNVFTVHGWSFTKGVPPVKRLVYLIFEKIISIYTDRLITVSDYDRKLALKYGIISSHNVVTIHNGSPDLFDGIRKKKGNPLRGVMVARFQTQKDHQTLFQALKRLKNDDVIIDLIGDGPLEEKYKKQAEELGLSNIIKFNGSSENVSDFLNSSDFFLLISNYEGLPLSICEALSCGLPIIASDVGGVRELIQDEESGFLIPKGDSVRLTERITQLMTDQNKLNEMSICARKNFEKNFTVDKMIKETENYYFKILDEKH